MPTPRWSDDTHFTVDDTEFETSYSMDSTGSHFKICKHQRLVADLQRILAEFPAANIFELGIRAGGSAALLALLAEPRKLVAIELSPEPVAGLTSFIERRGLHEVVRPYYGIDQADRHRLTEIRAAEFGAEHLDLIVDDASHHLHPTRVSFETLFPHVRPGGLYLIEDWNWQHKLFGSLVPTDASGSAWDDLLSDTLEGDPEARAAFEAQIGAVLADDAHPDQALIRRRFERVLAGEHPDPPTRHELVPIFSPDTGSGEPSLVSLVFELVLACSEARDAIADVAVGPWWAAVRRGPAPIDPDTFRLGSLYTDPYELLRGLPLPSEADPEPF